MREGIRLYKLGKYREALENLRSVKVAERDYAELSYFLGLCYTKLEQFEEALLYLEQVVTSELGFAQVYQARMILAYIYALTERHRLAEFELQRLIEDGYDSVQVHAALGYVLYREKKHAAAIKQLESGLAIDPANPTVLNTLAFIMAEENIRPGAALSYVRRALVAKPDHPAYLDTLGWVLFRMGDFKEALEHLRRARKAWPENQEIRDHIRKVMERNNETQR
ncbi:tetratricopeptide repeat protein [Spirochaeta lutea]|uniref:tetratricopeptide repeat protein n=1 Tax=Spirochaeta lutea TaxID=1480694 RepID=UPI000566CBF7|nr:tetratricopeptide repeat protein [Spirochaeta lutea]